MEKPSIATTNARILMRAGAIRFWLEGGEVPEPAVKQP